MGAKRTVWHVLFVALIEERGPPGLTVIPEVVLTSEPQKGDILIIRQETGFDPDQAKVLHGLWRELSAVSLVEFKSASRPARPGDWIKLLGYGAQYHAKNVDNVDSAGNLTLVFVVPSLTPTILDESKRLGWILSPLSPGYHRVTGATYPGLVVVLNQVAREERDHLLRWFGSAKILDDETARWVWAHTPGSAEAEMEKLEGYEEVVDQLLASLPPERRVAGLKPEERLAGMKPEERLAGMKPEEAVLALPNELLRGLSEDYISSLPDPIRAEIRKRLQH